MFLQHGLAAGDLNQAAVWTKALHFFEDLLRGHLTAALKGIFAVAPGAAQIASRQPNEYARQPSVRGFSLERFVDFGYLHLGLPAVLAKPATHYSEYFAVVVSVSNTVTSFTRTRPFVTRCSRVFDSS